MARSQSSTSRPVLTQRAIRNTALHYLTAGAQTPKAGEVEAARATQRAFRHVTFANNLTDRLEGLAALARTDSPERTRAFAHYRKLWADRPGLARHLDRLDPPSGTKKPDAKKPDAKKPDGKKPRRKKSASKKPNPPRRAVMPGL